MRNLHRGTEGHPKRTHARCRRSAPDWPTPASQTIADPQPPRPTAHGTTDAGAPTGAPTTLRFNPQCGAPPPPSAQPVAFAGTVRRLPKPAGRAASATGRRPRPAGVSPRPRVPTRRRPSPTRSGPPNWTLRARRVARASFLSPHMHCCAVSEPHGEFVARKLCVRQKRKGPAPPRDMK